MLRHTDMTSHPISSKFPSLFSTVIVLYYNKPVLQKMSQNAKMRKKDRWKIITKNILFQKWKLMVNPYSQWGWGEGGTSRDLSCNQTPYSLQDELQREEAAGRTLLCSKNLSRFLLLRVGKRGVGVGDHREVDWLFELCCPPTSCTYLFYHIWYMLSSGSCWQIQCCKLRYPDIYKRVLSFNKFQHCADFDGSYFI